MNSLHSFLCCIHESDLGIGNMWGMAGWGCAGVVHAGIGNTSETDIRGSNCVN